ncbi:MAG: orotidine-5'-phosphate decarboxylase [Phycisphaerales bacterium]
MSSAPAQPNEERSFADRLCSAIDAAGSPVCVGLDPVQQKLPAEVRRRTSEPADAFRTFGLGVLEACRGIVPAIKPKAACFERLGPPGLSVLHELIEAGRAMGYVMVLDAKRGDIGITAEHYAESAFGPAVLADALTVSAYLGTDTVAPYLAHPGRGVFVLVRTSNPGSDAVQSVRLADGRTVAEMMADHVAELGRGRLGTCGLSDVGAVVAATKPADAAALRARMPDQYFLIPGYGAQGGTAEDIRALFRPGARSLGTAGVLVTASRSVIYPGPAEASADWEDAIALAARSFAQEVATMGA